MNVTSNRTRCVCAVARNSSTRSVQFLTPVRVMSSKGIRVTFTVCFFWSVLSAVVSSCHSTTCSHKIVVLCFISTKYTLKLFPLTIRNFLVSLFLIPPTRPLCLAFTLVHTLVVCLLSPKKRSRHSLSFILLLQQASFCVVNVFSLTSVTYSLPPSIVLPIDAMPLIFICAFSPRLKLNHRKKSNLPDMLHLSRLKRRFSNHFDSTTMYRTKLSVLVACTNAAKIKSFAMLQRRKFSKFPHVQSNLPLGSLRKHLCELHLQWLTGEMFAKTWKSAYNFIDYNVERDGTKGTRFQLMLCMKFNQCATRKSKKVAMIRSIDEAIFWFISFMCLNQVKMIYRNVVCCCLLLSPKGNSSQHFNGNCDGMGALGWFRLHRLPWAMVSFTQNQFTFK